MSSSVRFPPLESPLIFAQELDRKKKLLGRTSIFQNFKVGLPSPRDLLDRASNFVCLPAARCSLRESDVDVRSSPSGPNVQAHPNWLVVVSLHRGTPPLAS